MNRSDNCCSADKRSTLLLLLFGIDVAMILITIILNLSGIVLLAITERNKWANQNILLIHFSVVSFVNLFANGAAVYFKVYRILFPHWYIVVYYIGYFAYIINLVLLTLERLLHFILHIKYQLLITKRRLFYSLLVLWISAISYGVGIKYGGLVNNAKYNNYAAFVYNGFVVLFTAFTYIIILITVKKSSRVTNSSNLRREKSKKKKYIVPLCIVGSFFIFNVLPVIIIHAFGVPKKSFQVVVVGLIGVNVLSYFFDPIIYIYFQPKVRKKMHSLFLRFMRKTADAFNTCKSIKTDHSDLTRHLLENDWSGDTGDTLSTSNVDTTIYIPAPST